MRLWLGWAVPCVLSFVVFSSCSDQEGDEPDDAGGSAGEPSSPGAAGAGGTGAGGTGGGGGGGETSDGNSGGSTGGGDDGSYAGAKGCDIADQCGGCDAGGFHVLCSDGETSFYGQDYDEPDEVCTAAQAQSGAGGAGTQQAFCDSYVEPGFRIHRCHDCAATKEERKQLECVIADECCVVVWRQGCDI